MTTQLDRRVPGALVGLLAGAALAAAAVLLTMATATAATPSNASTISAGEHHTCELDDYGVECWGYNPNGQTDVPDTLYNPVAMSAGGNYSCALDENADGSRNVECWGHGIPAMPASVVLSNPIAISAGGGHTCVLDENPDGSTEVECWGANRYGQAIGTAQNPRPTLSNPTAVSAGGAHTCALDDSGVVCWGGSAILGQTDVPDLTNPTAIDASFYHTCALDDTGVVCWGGDTDIANQAGLNKGQSDAPDTLQNPIAVSGGHYLSCAIDDTGVVQRVQLQRSSTGSGRVTTYTLHKVRYRFTPCRLGGFDQ